jgi:hypothetical protein
MNAEKKRSKRAKVGDILEVRVPGGLAYLQYIAKHARYGEMILVSSPRHRVRPQATTRLFDGAYVTFYPVGAAVRHGLVDIVGHAPISAGTPPTRFRRTGARPRDGGPVETWVIEDESGETVRTSLSDEERSLPIVRLLNHEALIHYIVTGWRPEVEG